MAVEQTTLDAMREQAPLLQNGTYTVSHPERDHFTLSVKTALGGALAGKRIVAVLTGPDNNSDYMGVAFWDDEKGRAVVWKKHRSGEGNGVIDGYNWSERWGLVERKVAIMLDLAIRGDGSFWRAEGYELLRAGTCLKCNRKLTTPESIQLGIGPICAGK